MQLDGFNANEYESKGSWQPIPNGTYTAHIKTSKQVQKQNGVQIELDWEILEGEHKGQGFKEWLWYTHSNPKAQGVGRSRLAAICKAVKIHTPTSTEDLHFNPMVIKVVVKKNDYNGKMVNEISEVMSKQEAFAKQSKEPVQADDTPW